MIRNKGFANLPPATQAAVVSFMPAPDYTKVIQVGSMKMETEDILSKPFFKDFVKKNARQMMKAANAFGSKLSLLVLYLWSLGHWQNALPYGVKESAINKVI